MFGKRQANLTLTERAQAQITRWLEGAQRTGRLKSPMVGISWVRPSGAPREGWGIGFYDRARIDELPGWLFIAPEFEFWVVQEWILYKFDNKVLDINEQERITIEPQDNQAK